MTARMQRCQRMGIMFLVVAIGCGGKQEAISAPEPQTTAPPATTASHGTAAITGTATLKGPPSAPQTIQMQADPVCHQQHTSPVRTDDVVVANGRLANVFVYVKEGLANYPLTPPTTPVVLDQKGCLYAPHVTGVQVNQPLEIRNSDATLHNINAKPQGNQPFNIAQPVQGMKTTKKFMKPEVMIPLKCNVHPWMSGYVGVVAHPFFAVTDTQGNFQLTGLPAGTYVLEAWHERFGTTAQTVTLGDGATHTLELSFQAK